MKNILILFLLISLSNSLFSQSTSPKREFRGAWIATVSNIDWPKPVSTNPVIQKQQLITLLDGLKAININAVMFQIRPECDALYQSSIEPWSRWLTGSQGTAPNPLYDPLQYAIDEAHKRGMELHAWFNPYRAERTVGSYPLSPNHVINLHPDWILQVGSVKFLNPGLQAVRDYVTSVFIDVARRYDVDGIHIDDYFYVDGIAKQDSATFANYPRGFANLGDWRRDNVNILIKQINDSLKILKPWVKWGVSPRGIWRPGYPPGITGNDNYNTIYCDAMAWLHAKSIDYINPQLYWAFGGGQDYGKLMPWWADSAGANGRHLYVGHAVYRINPDFTASELPNQIRLNRTDNFCQGSVHYNTSSTLGNPKGFTDSLKNDLYRYKALNPIMIWKDIIAPNPPQNLRYETLSGNQIKLIWDLPTTASDGDSAYRYVVYRFNHSNIQLSGLDSSANILNVEGSRQSSPPVPPNPTGTYYYVVTSLDRNNNESPISNILTVNPLQPISVLTITALIEGLYNGSTMISDTVTVQFKNSSSPFGLIEEKKVILNTNGMGTAAFTSVIEGSSYYLVIKHRNGVETWTKTSQTITAHALTYNFTVDSSKAFGNNLIKKGTKWCIYSGDVNQDGAVNSADVTLISDDAFNYLASYRVTDLTGDNFVDLNDLILCDNNAFKSVYKLSP